MCHHGIAHTREVRIRHRAPERVDILVRTRDREVSDHRIVRRGLVGHELRREASGHHLRQHLGRIAEQADGKCAPLSPCAFGLRNCIIERRCHGVEVACLESALDARRVDLDADADTASERHGERLRATHATESRSHGDRSCKRPVEVLIGRGGKGLVRALQDSLRADVDPASRRHLAVHHEAELVESIELLPGRPLRHQVRVGDEHAWRMRVRLQDSHRLARLHEQRFVILEPVQCRHDALVALPVTCSLATSAVHDELVRLLCDIRVEVVHEHALRCFLNPSLGGPDVPACGSNDRCHV